MKKPLHKEHFKDRDSLTISQRFKLRKLLANPDESPENAAEKATEEHYQNNNLELTKEVIRYECQRLKSAFRLLLLALLDYTKNILKAAKDATRI